MTNGACNILTNNFGPDVSSLSIANLKKIIELQGNDNLGGGIRKKRKTRKTRKPNKKTKTMKRTRTINRNKIRKIKISIKNKK